MSIDLTKDQDAILVDLINQENNLHLIATDLLLGSVSIAPDPVPEREVFNNTRSALTVSPAPGSGYINQSNIKYNRISVRDMFHTTEPTSVRYPNTTDGIYRDGRTSVLSILDEINSLYEINLREEDIFDAPLPVFEGPPPYANAYVRFEVKAPNKIFIGGVNLRILPDPWELSQLQYVELAGLYYPNGDPELPPVIVTVSGAVEDQLALLASPGYWNYTSIAPTAAQ